MNKLEQAARALLAHWDTPAWKYLKPTGDLMADLREALAEQAEQEQYPTYGFCPICGSRGILRERRIDGNDTCANGHSYASNLALHIAPEKQAEQEPVAIMSPNKANIVGINTPYAKIGTDDWIKLYAAPVRTKGLTDDEIYKLADDVDWAAGDYLGFARAVIAANREKNKCQH